MKKAVYLFFVFLMGVQFSAEAQILKKIGKVVKEAAEEVLVEKLGEGHETNGKDQTPAPVIKNDKEGLAVAGMETATGGQDVKNFFEGSTRTEVYGEANSVLSISPDKKHIALNGYQGSRPAVLVNGKSGPAMDEIESFSFSPTGGHYAYVGKRGEKCVLVIDGKESEPEDCEQLKRPDFHFSKDGNFLAYRKYTNRYEGVIVVNGQEGPPLESSKFTSTPLSANKYIFYVGPDGLYRNNELIEEDPSISSFQVTEDGEFYTYLSDRKAIVINGEIFSEPASRPYFPPLLDRESRAVLYGTNINKPTDLVFSGKHYRTPPTDVFLREFKVSPDGKQFAYSTNNEKGKRFWLNAQPGPYFDDLGGAAFTGDSQNFIYWGRANGKDILMVNEVAEEFDDIMDLKVSESGDLFTFVGRKEGESYRYLKDEKLDKPQFVNHFTFSPVGQMYVYSTGTLIRPTGVVVNGKKFTDPDMTSLGSFYVGKGLKNKLFVFNDQGERVAYSYFRINDKKKESVLMVDDKRFLSGANHDFALPTFSPDGKHFAFLSPVLAEGNKFLWRLYIDLKPGPIVGEVDQGRKNPEVMSLFFTDNNSIKTYGSLDGKIVAHTVSFD